MQKISCKHYKFQFFFFANKKQRYEPRKKKSCLRKNSSHEMIRNLGKEEKLTVTQKFLHESWQAEKGHSAMIKDHCRK
jgi:hypothetical protein